jgi:hypothetical protein
MASSQDFKRTLNLTIDDITAETYKLKNPREASIPLNSLEMQRKPTVFQMDQKYLHKKGLLEASFSSDPRYMPGPTAEYQNSNGATKLYNRPKMGKQFYPEYAAQNPNAVLP